jgi:hypothetical protein
LSYAPTFLPAYQRVSGAANWQVQSPKICTNFARMALETSANLSTVQHSNPTKQSPIA